MFRIPDPTKKGRPPSFKKAIDKTPLKSCLKDGLKAMGANSKYVKARDNSIVQGSVDIDNCLKKDYPDKPRWDYVLGYGGEAVFVEVHPAGTSNVRDLIQKKNWLEEWLKQTPDLAQFPRRKSAFVWVNTSKVDIRGGNNRKKLAECGINGPVNPLRLD